MNDFYVDPSGLRALSGQLARAAGDARDTLDYTRRHCELSWDRRGLLMLVGRRRRFLNYLQRSDLERYRSVVRELGLRR